MSLDELLRLLWLTALVVIGAYLAAGVIVALLAGAVP